MDSMNIDVPNGNEASRSIPGLEASGAMLPVQVPSRAAGFLITAPGSQAPPARDVEKRGT
jgi:hypothetical protein